MNKTKQILLSIVSILLGCVFLYSAWTKFDPIEVFENTLVEHVGFNWLTASVTARLFVGLEAALGFLLILHLYAKRKLVIRFSIALLVAFSCYLVFLWVRLGDDVNCGCFGDAIWMTPTQSLIKNAFMLAALWLLLIYHNGFRFRLTNILAIIAIPVVTILPLFIHPVPAQQPDWLRTDRYQADFSVVNANTDLNKGKHIVAFFSLTCPHCRVAAYKMHLMKKNNPSLPFYMVLNGDKEDLPNFMKETKADNIPSSILLGEEFINLSGLKLPAIYWVNNSWVEAKTKYISLNQQEIEKWLTQP